MPNLYVIMKNEGVESWFSSLKPSSNSFVTDERIVWISLEGLPLKVWSRNTFAKVASKWGDLVEWEDLAEKSLFCKRFESSDDEEDAKDDGSHSRDKVTTDNDVKRVSESSCMHNNDLLYDNNYNNIMPDKDKVLSDDPFNLYDILNKRKDSGDDLKYPPGFTPSVINVEEVNKKVKGATSNEVNEHVNSTSNKLEESVPKGKLSSNNSVCSKRVHTGGSILQLMDELVKVGQTMGYNMEGCMRNIEVIIGSQGECNVHGVVLGLKRLHGFLKVNVAQVHNGNYAKWFGINKWYQSFALRNFDLDDMELESTNSGPTAKLPILKLGDVSDNTVYAFMVENSNGSNVLHQDLEQIHEDDLEAMDLKLVECYNCHKLGHFARAVQSTKKYGRVSSEIQGNTWDARREEKETMKITSKAMFGYLMCRFV
ncbi:hypothetical protein Tco_0471968 [Tanacetum coccineum]